MFTFARALLFLVKESVSSFRVFLSVVSPLSSEFFDQIANEREKGKQGKGKRERNAVPFSRSYASLGSELNKRGNDGRELLFNSLKLYA